MSITFVLLKDFGLFVRGISIQEEFSELLYRSFKGVPSGLRPFLTTESPLKTMKNAFYFTLKILFVLEILKFLS